MVSRTGRRWPKPEKQGSWAAGRRPAAAEAAPAATIANSAGVAERRRRRLAEGAASSRLPARGVPDDRRPCRRPRRPRARTCRCAGPPTDACHRDADHAPAQTQPAAGATCTLVGPGPCAESAFARGPETRPWPMTRPKRKTPGSGTSPAAQRAHPLLGPLLWRQRARAAPQPSLPLFFRLLSAPLAPSAWRRAPTLLGTELARAL